MSAISIQTDVMSNPGEESGLLRSKTSVLGRVPKEWEVVNLSDVFQLKQGIQCAVENQSRQRREGYKRFIRIIDLTNPDESCRYIEDPGPAHHLGLNDLFMVRYGSPGLLGLGYEGVIANNLFRLLPKRNLDSLFYYHYLGSRQKDIAELSGSSTMAAVSFSSLRNLSLIYPPIAEQRVIGGVLSDLDTLLNSLGTLIAKKKAIKQGAMQQLLTGKQRLPGFEGEWEVTSLDEVAYRVTGFWGS